MIRIVKKDNFEERKAALYSDIGKENNLASMMQELRFPVGTNLNLNVEITDEYMSQILYSLLYGTGLIEGSENLGFKITSINTDCIDKNLVIKKLQDLIDLVRGEEI